MCKWHVQPVNRIRFFVSLDFVNILFNKVILIINFNKFKLKSFIMTHMHLYFIKNSGLQGVQFVQIKSYI